MTTYFVTRHPGAVEWAARQGLHVDQVISHLDPAVVQPGDVVIGTLPVNLGAAVCAKGARLLHLTVELPPDLRGRELSAEELDRYGARLEEYWVSRSPTPQPASPPRPDIQTAKRLITFLGTGDYQPVTYVLPGATTEPRAAHETPYVAYALAELLSPAEVLVLATEEAAQKHEDALLQEFRTHRLKMPVRFERIPAGQTVQEIWEAFDILQACLAQEGCEEIILDISHGFRSQPFFAAAVVAFYRAVVESPKPVSIYYGAFDARQDGQAPVWNLTPFTELTDWTRGIREFLHTGSMGSLANQAEEAARRYHKAWAERGRQGQRPRLQQFANALREAGEDLAFVRTGSLIAGRDISKQDRQRFDRPTAITLARALEEAREDIERAIPPLARVLPQLGRLIEPLCQGTLSGEEGQYALAALARLYVRWSRYAEAAVILREGWTSRYAERSTQVPGRSFDNDARNKAEDWLRQQNPDFVDDLTRVRNDIEHGGFRRDPQPPKALKRDLEHLLEKFEQTLRARSPASGTPEPGPASNQEERSGGLPEENL